MLVLVRNEISNYIFIKLMTFRCSIKYQKLWYLNGLYLLIRCESQYLLVNYNGLSCTTCFCILISLAAIWLVIGSFCICLQIQRFVFIKKCSESLCSTDYVWGCSRLKVGWFCLNYSLILNVIKIHNYSSKLCCWQSRTLIPEKQCQ